MTRADVRGPPRQQPELPRALCRWRDAVRAFQAAALAEELGEMDDAGSAALWEALQEAEQVLLDHAEAISPYQPSRPGGEATDP
jgi:hypothetical protein